MNTLPFRILRRLGSVPSVLVLTGLLIGGISAYHAAVEFMNQAPDQFFSVNGVLAGNR